MRLLVATGNPGKLQEFKRLLGRIPGLEVLGPGEMGLADLEVVEDGVTFADNARKKAQAFASAAGLPALADDSGLEVDALAGAPGVYSARYAGPGASDAENNHKLLAALAGIPESERSARFRCVLVLLDPSGAHLELVAEGTCPGTVLAAPRGQHGFGYDPIFAPEGESRTMAELDPDHKAALSHRGRATAQMVSLLRARLSLPADPAG